MENLLIENIVGNAPIIFFAGGFLSIFKSKKKPNLTPSIVPMDYGNLYHTPELRQFASDRISGKTAGFGDDYVSKTANPVIASREARFNEIEMPQLNSQLSSRGLARSAGPNLATDVITRAGQQKERDVNEIMAQFYQLNEAQKKRDVTEGVGVAQNSQGQQERMQAAQAAESRRQIEQTAAQQRAYEDMDRGNLDKIGALLMSAGSGAISGGFGMNLPGATSASKFNVQNALLGAFGGNQNVGGTQILGRDETDSFLRAYMAMKGIR